MTKTITEYKKLYNEICPERVDIDYALARVLEKIKFLESIYMTGGENHNYSEAFGDSAHREREELCKRSSALYSIIRELDETKS